MSFWHPGNRHCVFIIAWEASVWGLSWGSLWLPHPRPVPCPPSSWKCPQPNLSVWGFPVQVWLSPLRNIMGMKGTQTGVILDQERMSMNCSVSYPVPGSVWELVDYALFIVLEFPKCPPSPLHSPGQSVRWCEWGICEVL